MSFIVYTVVLLMSVMNVAVGFELLSKPIERIENAKICSEIQHPAEAKPPVPKHATTSARCRRDERDTLSQIYPAAPDASAGRVRITSEGAGGADRRASAETPARS